VAHGGSEVTRPGLSRQVGFAPVAQDKLMSIIADPAKRPGNEERNP